MSKIELITDIDKYQKSLMGIYNESIEYFMEVEGRRPLSPFDDIYSVEPEIPKDNPVQCYAFLFEGEIVGYSWIMEEISDELYYILHFSIADSFKRQKLGTRALQAIEDMYKNYEKSELLVSSKKLLWVEFLGKKWIHRNNMGIFIRGTKDRFNRVEFEKTYSQITFSLLKRQILI